MKRALAFNPNGILRGARRIAFVGTYAYILCDHGLVVVDLNNPLAPKVTADIGAPALDGATGIAVQSRYAFVTDRTGLKVLNITQPETPVLVQNAQVPMDDARNIYVARTYAYVSAGKNGIQIINIERPGFSPKPVPKLIASFPTHGPALAISRGIDRDRAVDETGNQLAVFGRRGSRPLNRQEMQALYLRNGQLYTVSDEPQTAAVAGAPQRK